ncbi:hypothetical protein AAAC13_17045 [Pseudomonas aeruginosa]
MRTAYPLDSAVRLLARKLPDSSRVGYRGQSVDALLGIDLNGQ